jgi:hypothetical protein
VWGKPQMKKTGIALLITLLFIMAISISIGVGLKYVNDASAEVENENFLFQSRVVTDDIINLLKNSKEMEAIAKDNSIEGLFIFLSQSGFIPFEIADLKVSIEIGSARAKFNPNTLSDGNNSIELQRVDALKEYVSRYRVEHTYVDILLDNMNPANNSYNSSIFNDNPYLFREYISSDAHLEEINDFYTQTHYDNNLKNIDFDKLFYLSPDRHTKIDLNYATPEVWEMILGVDKQRAEQLSLGSGSYTDLESLALDEEEIISLGRFDVSYFEPSLDIRLHISKDDKSADIKFEYDIKNKKGLNFSHAI